VAPAPEVTILVEFAGARFQRPEPVPTDDTGLTLDLATG
jgi:hypothetical protein